MKIANLFYLPEIKVTFSLLMFCICLTSESWSVDTCQKSGMSVSFECKNWCTSSQLDPTSYMGCLCGCGHYSFALRNDDLKCEGKVLYDRTAPVGIPSNNLCAMNGYSVIDYCAKRCNFRAGQTVDSCKIGCRRYYEIYGDSGCWDKIWHEH